MTYHYSMFRKILLEPERKYIIEQVFPPINEIIYVRCNILKSKIVLDFTNKIRDKEIKNNKQFTDIYMKAVKKMLFKYEFYFKLKLGRNVKKKSNN